MKEVCDQCGGHAPPTTPWRYIDERPLVDNKWLCNRCFGETMALDKMMQDLVTETITTLRAAPFTHDCVVRISPRRMRALHLQAQQTITAQFNGKVITLQEDSDAPELSQEIENVLAPVRDVKEDIATPEDLAEFARWRASRKAPSESP